MIVVGIYIRTPITDLERFRRKPELLRKLDERVALRDGRAIDLGRGWEELGCLLEGGISAPQAGPTVGEAALASAAGVAWASVEPGRVREMAAELAAMTREQFWGLYQVDEDETADAAPGERTERHVDHVAYLFRKLEQLRGHYAEAAKRGEAMLVRLGERPYEDPPESLR